MAMTHILIKIKNLFLSIYWRRVFILLIVAAVFAFPFPVYKVIGRFNNVPLDTEIETISLPTSEDALIAPLFTRVTGIPLNAMGQEICLENKNHILFDGEEKQLSEVLDRNEGAAMSLNIYYPGQRVDSLYVQKDQVKCIDLDGAYKEATTTNQVEVRSVLPVEVPYIVSSEEGIVMQAKVASESSIDIRDSIISRRVVFDWRTYLQNAFLIIVGEILLLSALMSVCIRGGNAESHVVKSK